MENQENGDELPRYALRLLPYANRALDEALAFVADTSGKEGTDADGYAAAFRKGVLNAIGTLAALPARFPVAREAAFMNPPPVRVMIHRQRPDGPAWRILYRIYEADVNEAARVEIAALLHGAQKPITRAEGRGIDAANR